MVRNRYWKKASRSHFVPSKQKVVAAFDVKIAGASGCFHDTVCSLATAVSSLALIEVVEFF